MTKDSIKKSSIKTVKEKSTSSKEKIVSTTSKKSPKKTIFKSANTKDVGDFLTKYLK